MIGQFSGVEPLSVRLDRIEAQFQRGGVPYGPIPTFTAADLPSAADWLRCLIYVSDETGGATIAFSDGSQWRRVQDRAVIS